MNEACIQRIAKDALSLAAALMASSPKTPFTSVDAWVAGAMPGIVAVEAQKERELAAMGPAAQAQERRQGW